MPFHKAMRAGLAAVAVFAASAAAPQETDTKTYDLSLSGVPLGTVTLRAEQSDGQYEAASRITPNGLVSLVGSYSFNGRARGSIDAAGRVVPSSFVADSRSPRAERRTEIEWRDGAPVRVSVEPPRNFAPDPERVAGALDPVSAGFALLRDNAPDKICNTRVDVFDGSRRSRLSVARAVDSDGGFTCAGMYARLEGETHSMSSQSDYPFTLYFTRHGAGQVQLDRIETRTRFGLAVVSRRG